MANASRGRTPFALAAVGLLFLTPAAVGAATPQATPQVEITAEPNGASGVVHAQVDIADTPADVWRVVIDCGQVARLMVNVKFCRVLDRDPMGRWDVREQVTKGALLPGVRTVLRVDYDPPHTARFHRIDGDFKVLDGEWRLEPLDGGVHTRVFYESRMSAPFAAPGFLIRAVLRRDVPHTLANLRDVCQTNTAARLAQNGRP
jgi:hypothetical protein